MKSVKKGKDSPLKDDVFLTDLLKRAEDINYDFDPNRYNFK
jgi:hypothetical protein